MLREILSNVFFYNGLPFALQHLCRKGNNIFIYHRVLPEGHEDIQFTHPGMYVTTKTFESQKKYMTENYKLLTIDSLIHEHRPSNGRIVTFDDGWGDNYHYALPILGKYNVPATIFLTTGNIGGNRWPWTGRLCC